MLTILSNLGTKSLFAWLPNIFQTSCWVFVHLWEVFACVCVASHLIFLAYICRDTVYCFTHYDDTAWLWLWVLTHMWESAYCKSLRVCVCTHVGAASCIYTRSCYIVEPQQCGSGWAKCSKGRKWRQMNREELNTLPLSSILLILYTPLHLLFSFPSYPPSPWENITQPHRKTPGIIIKSAKAWHFLCYFRVTGN